MDAGVISIAPWRLLLALVFTLLAGGCSLALKLGLGRDILIGTVRTFAQLFLMGWVLGFVFAVDSPWLVLALFLVMAAAAAHTARGRVKESAVSFAWPMYGSMAAVYLLITVTVTGGIVHAEPWWKPQYFLPIGGMVLGNSMNSVAVALDRLFSDLRARASVVEMQLCLGADAAEASADMTRAAVRAGMIPSINSMMAVGLVSIPGMMTGQILGGSDPTQAIRYQIVVMLMLVGATALGSTVLTLLIRRRCFGPGDRPLLR
ncbi:MAG: iron export ABC transporter permease subunit FetB [Humidesulfovibrio sp.]|nr:iron export ABC transporter permease subunit FetB [Humidesulfovibrio sp.]